MNGDGEDSGRQHKIWHSIKLILTYSVEFDSIIYKFIVISKTTCVTKFVLQQNLTFNIKLFICFNIKLILSQKFKVHDVNSAFETCC